MTNHRRTVFILLLVLLVTTPQIVQARVQKVGPTQFHKQMHVPNSIGRSGSANNQDSYTESVWNKRHKQRMTRHQKRKQQNNAVNAESRTASDLAVTGKRKGRRDNNVTATNRRLQRNALDNLATQARKAVND